MPTGTELKERDAFLKDQGQLVTLLGKDRQRRTWYRPDGVAIPNLPFDGYHLARYQARGWTMKPPIQHCGTARGEAASATEPPAPLATVIPVAKPPKHIHVMQEHLGAPCLVAGCGHIRREPKTGWNAKKGQRG